MNEKNEIENTLSEIRKTMDDSNPSSIKEANEKKLVILNKIVKKKKNNSIIKEDHQTTDGNQNTITQSSAIIIKKKTNTKNVQEKKLEIKNKKNKDPIADLVEREIKPIIQKWINKNLKKFVKTIVIDEMKLISKVIQKQK